MIEKAIKWYFKKDHTFELILLRINLFHVDQTIVARVVSHILIPLNRSFRDIFFYVHLFFVFVYCVWLCEIKSSRVQEPFEITLLGEIMFVYGFFKLVEFIYLWTWLSHWLNSIHKKKLEKKKRPRNNITHSQVFLTINLHSVRLLNGNLIFCFLNFLKNRATNNEYYCFEISFICTRKRTKKHKSTTEDCSHNFSMIFTPYASYFTIGKHEDSYQSKCACAVNNTTTWWVVF